MGHSFKNIGLAFSGGGFRAASFTLGNLSFFDKIGILKEVKGISSVSGGSITATKYAQCLIDGYTFEQFFDEYYAFLSENTLSEKALTTLNTKSEWDKKENNHKSVNAINAFSIQYNRLTKHKTLGDFEKYAQQKNATLKKIFINASDFSESIQFRIKNLDSKNEKFGNGKIYDRSKKYQEYWESVKLGDALAASSAFPGGFEPILYPKDFVGEIKGLCDISLLDGGIIDNQGTSALLPNYKQKDLSKHKYGFYFVCDVASPYVDEPYKAKPAQLLSKVLEYFSSFWFLIVLLLGTLFFYSEQMLLYYSISLILLTFTVIVQLGLVFASRNINKMTGIKNRIRIPTKKLGHYILNRIESLVYMMNIVMLKSARRSIANNLYERFESTSITASIYELRCEKNQYKRVNKGLPFHPEGQKEWREIRIHTKDISAFIKSNTKQVAAFGTTLWFNNKDVEAEMLDRIIACGQYTTCYNLIAHMVQNNGELTIEKDNEKKELFNSLISYWENFQKDPFWLLNESKKVLDYPI